MTGAAMSTGFSAQVSRWASFRGHARHRGAFALVALGVIVSLVGATIASASHGGDIDLTVANAEVTHNGALWVQGGTGAGTGTFDPFLTLQADGNADTEHGYNTAGAGEFDTFFGGGRTHELRVSAIPAVDVGGTLYREFSLDANDQGVDDYMSIDDFVVMVDDEDDLTGYNTGAQTFSSDSGSTAYTVYDMDAGGDITAFMRSQTLTPGSGVSDITVLIPDSVFPAECSYGAPVDECDLWVYLYTASGNAGVIGDIDWNVTSGFEEWRTQLLPVVNVSKDVTATHTETSEWDITKSVDVDEWNLFDGQSATSEYTIELTKTGSTVTSVSLTGTITVTNPTGGAVIGDDIDATILSVSDVLNLGAGAEAATVDCGVEFPYVLGDGETLVCTYELGSPSSTTDGTNLATVVLDNDDSADLEYTGTADVVWVETLVNDEVNISDSNGSDFGPFSGSDTVTYEREFVCAATGEEGGDEGVHDNTATIVETEQSDDASVTVNCTPPPPIGTPVVQVVKDVTATYTETFEWDITKSVDVAEWNLFYGESGTSEYTIELTQTGSTVTGVSLTGSITITNPNIEGAIAATLLSVSDVVSLGAGDEAATVDCGVEFPYPLAVGEVLECSYELDSPSSTTDGSNLATVVVDDGDDPDLEYTGSADVVWDATLVNDEVNISDSNGSDFGPFSGSDTVTYEREFVCAATGEEGGDEGVHDNTATIVETEQSDDASVTVNCSAEPTPTPTPSPTPSPTATPPAPTPTPEVAAATVGIDNTRTSPSPTLVGTGVTFRKDVTLTDVPGTNVANVMVEFDPMYLHFINASQGGSLIANCTLQEAGVIICLFGVQDADFSFDVHYTALVVTESTETHATLFADFDGAGPDGDVTAGPATDDVAIIDVEGIELPPLGDGSMATPAGGIAPLMLAGLAVLLGTLLGGGAGALRRIRLS